MSARAPKHPKETSDRSNERDSTRALARKDPSISAEEDTASARARLERGIEDTGRNVSSVAVPRARRGACGGPASRPILFEVIWRVLRQGSGKGGFTPGARRGGWETHVKPRRCASSVCGDSLDDSGFRSRALLCVRRASRAVTSPRLTRLFLPTSFVASVTRYDGTAGFVGLVRFRSPLSLGKAREFWRQSVTPGFSRIKSRSPRHEEEKRCIR